MLKMILASTALILCIGDAQAQTPADILHSWSSGECQGVDNCRAYLQEQDRQRDQIRRDTYQPYPTVEPRIEPLDSFGTHRPRGLYGDDDED
jgi:hypothetical protein